MIQIHYIHYVHWMHLFQHTAPPHLELNYNASSSCGRCSHAVRNSINGNWIVLEWVYVNVFQVHFTIKATALLYSDWWARPITEKEESSRSDFTSVRLQEITCWGVWGMEIFLCYYVLFWVPPLAISIPFNGHFDVCVYVHMWKEGFLFQFNQFQCKKRSIWYMYNLRTTKSNQEWRLPSGFCVL